MASESLSTRSRAEVPSQAAAGTPLLVDCHAHVFTANCRLADKRRYTPAYEAPFEAYLDELDRHGVTHGVIVQPSFLGDDNSYLHISLERARGRLRGVAVVEPDVNDRELDRLKGSGVVGVRFNLLGEAWEKLTAPAWRDLVRRVEAFGWLIEVQVEGRDLPGVLDALEASRCPLVIDHFGRPNPTLGVLDPGFQRLLAEAPGGRIWVKLSGPWRCGGVEAARRYAEALAERLGPERLLWGSDWPWTQHEGQSYGACLDGLADWLDTEDARRQVLAQTAPKLFRIPLPSPLKATSSS